MKKNLIILLLFCSYMRPMEDLARGEEETAEWTHERWRYYVVWMDDQLYEVHKKRERIKVAHEMFEIMSEDSNIFTPEKIKEWFGPNFIEQCIEEGAHTKIPGILWRASLWEGSFYDSEAEESLIKNKDNLLKAILDCMGHSDESSNHESDSYSESGYASSQEDSESGLYPSYDSDSSSDDDEFVTSPSS